MSQEQTSLVGIEPRITDDADYPALIRELAEVVERQLRDAGVEPPHAAVVAEAAAEYVREHFGGQPLYWAKGETMRQRRKRERMWQLFNGRNHLELSREFGLCLQQTYRTLAIARKEHANRTQPDLFAGVQPPPADPHA